jgi:hypothetical protein
MKFRVLIDLQFLNKFNQNISVKTKSMNMAGGWQEEEKLLIRQFLKKKYEHGLQLKIVIHILFYRDMIKVLFPVSFFLTKLLMRW